jgi:hypothetical protein
MTIAAKSGPSPTRGRVAVPTALIAKPAASKNPLWR